MELKIVLDLCSHGLGCFAYTYIAVLMFIEPCSYLGCCLSCLRAMCLCLQCCGYVQVYLWCLAPAEGGMNVLMVLVLVMLYLCLGCCFQGSRFVFASGA